MVSRARGASLGGPPGPLLYNSRGGVWWVNGFLFFGPVLVPFDVAPQASSLLKVSSKSVDLTPCSHQVKPPYGFGEAKWSGSGGHSSPTPRQAVCGRHTRRGFSLSEAESVYELLLLFFLPAQAGAGRSGRTRAL